MQDTHFIQITDALPPRLHGIGDYAYKLASRAKELHRFDTSFLVLDSSHDSTEVEKQFPVHYLPPNQQEIISVLSGVLEANPEKRNIVLLHYNRGTIDRYIDVNKYEKNFFPLELIEFLGYVKGRREKPELITIFHEFLWPKIERRRDYFLRPMQNYFLKKVIKYSDLIICNNPTSASQINRLCKGSRIQISPVFSNIGELEINQPELKYKGSWVIFGSTIPLMKTVSRFLDDLSLIRESLAVEKVFIVGGIYNDEIRALADKISLSIPDVDYIPEALSRHISDVFRQSQFCYMNYFSQDLQSDSALIFKSGVFAAACSHGVIPVFGNPGMDCAIGQLNHPGFLVKENGRFNTLETDELHSLSARIFDWYYSRSSLDSTVQTIRELL